MLYADDLQIYLPFYDSKMFEATWKLQDDIDSISAWAEINHMWLNDEEKQKLFPSVPSTFLTPSLVILYYTYITKLSAFTPFLKTLEHQVLFQYQDR